MMQTIQKSIVDLRKVLRGRVTGRYLDILIFLGV